MTAKAAIKRTAQWIALCLALPSALLCAFGRWNVLYTFFAQYWALVPGLPGSFLRAAFYRMTLRSCSADVTVSFGTYFVHPDTVVGPYVSLGSYCVVGRCHIGERSQIASHVEITSGRHQHERTADGVLEGSLHGLVSIGARCWIGASAIVMADVGDGSTIGAGSVVVKEIPTGSTAVGNPARVIR